MGLYGDELHVIRSQNFDDGAVTPINVSAVASAVKIATMQLPGAPLYFGFYPTTTFLYGTAPTTGVLALYKYPQGLVCYDLPSTIAMCNSLVNTVIAHAADAVIHKLPDTSATMLAVTAVPVYDLTTLMAKVNLLQIAYAAHNVDAAAGSPTYHEAQDTTHTLADATPVTTLAMTITKLNDIVAKYNLHDMEELLAHNAGHQYQAIKVLLESIDLTQAAPVGKQYQVKVPTFPAATTVHGKAPAPVANYVAGDQLVVEVYLAAVGGTKSGAYRPFIAYQNRGENFASQAALVDQTVAGTGIPSA
jgi:hypothetical protein